jgi:hypothetical protein
VRKLILITMLLGSVLFSTRPSSSVTGQEKTVAGGATATENDIKVTITTGGGLYGPVKSRFKVGEDVPVVISMTNTGDKPAQYCRSTSLFQNRPQLKRDGQLIPYLTNLPQQVDQDEAVQRCEKSASRQFYKLQPKQTKVVDWFKISLLGIRWYGPLPAGHYELSLMRRIECCQGPMVESDKVAFEVVP